MQGARPYRDLAYGLARKNVISLRFDKRPFTYPRQYSGKVGTVEEERLADAVSAVNTLRIRPEVDPRRLFVLGHSLGGLLAPENRTARGGRRQSDSPCCSRATRYGVHPAVAPRRWGEASRPLTPRAASQISALGARGSSGAWDACRVLARFGEARRVRDRATTRCSDHLHTGSPRSQRTSGRPRGVGARSRRARSLRVRYPARGSSGQQQADFRSNRRPGRADWQNERPKPCRRPFRPPIVRLTIPTLCLRRPTEADPTPSPHRAELPRLER